MKKALACLITVVELVGIAGCNSRVFPPPSPSAAATHPQRTESDKTETEKVWTEQEILSLFRSTQQEHWHVLDCALMPDFAYDRVGVILFRDDTEGTTNLAFMDADGAYQKVGVSAKPYAEPNFTYLGNGAVAFQLEAEDGSPYMYKMTFSMEDNGINFKAEEE